MLEAPAADPLVPGAAHPPSRTASASGVKRGVSLETMIFPGMKVLR